MAWIPREKRFFDLLEQQADVVVWGAQALHECLAAKGTFDDMQLASRKIHQVEHEGDELVHQIMARLNKTFITPLDREDIHELTSRLDDVLDFVDAVAKRLVTFRVGEAPGYAVELSRIILESSKEVAVGIRLLWDLSQADAINRQCTRIPLPAGPPPSSTPRYASSTFESARPSSGVPAAIVAPKSSTVRRSRFP